MPPRVEVTGARELQRALKRMGADTRDMTRINKKAAQPVLDRARDIAPIVTGRLRRSIRLSARKGSASILAGGVRGVVYAGPIHFGWPRRNIEPQMFLYAALEDRREEVAGLYSDYVGDLVRRLDRETPE